MLDSYVTTNEEKFKEVQDSAALQLKPDSQHRKWETQVLLDCGTDSIYDDSDNKRQSIWVQRYF